MPGLTHLIGLILLSLSVETVVGTPAADQTLDKPRRRSFPNCTTTCFFVSRDLGEDFTPYLTSSYTFASLIKNRLTNGNLSDLGSLDPHNDPNSTYALLIFRNQNYIPRLAGFYFGKPVDMGGGTWRLDVIPCDYDIQDIYYQQLDAFTAGRDSILALPYVPPEEVSAGSIQYCLEGEHYRTGDTQSLADDDL